MHLGENENVRKHNVSKFSLTEESKSNFFLSLFDMFYLLFRFFHLAVLEEVQQNGTPEVADPSKHPEFALESNRLSTFRTVAPVDVSLRLRLR